MKIERKLEEAERKEEVSKSKAAKMAEDLSAKEQTLEKLKEQRTFLLTLGVIRGIIHSDEKDYVN